MGYKGFLSFTGSWSRLLGGPEPLWLDGSVVGPLVWRRGSKPKVRRVDTRLVVDLAGMPVTPGVSGLFLDYRGFLGLSLMRIFVPGPFLSLCW